MMVEKQFQQTIMTCSGSPLGLLFQADRAVRRYKLRLTEFEL